MEMQMEPEYNNINKKEEATLMVIPASGITLTVQEDESPPDIIGCLRLHSQLGNARFDRRIDRALFNSVDMLVISNKCARLLLTISNSVISGVNQSPEFSIFDIDKFYTPRTIVYGWNRKYYPVGTLGFQQVAPSLGIRAYSSMLKFHNDESSKPVAPISAASAFKSYNRHIEMGLDRDEDFVLLENYLKERGVIK
jgi:hypothetical protein